jgi:hypothetical protein
MTQIGDNDSQTIMVFEDTGNAITAVTWPEARRMLVAALAGETSNSAWLQGRAEDLLCAIFSGSPAPPAPTERP